MLRSPVRGTCQTRGASGRDNGDFFLPRRSPHELREHGAHRLGEVQVECPRHVEFDGDISDADAHPCRGETRNADLSVSTPV